jgi:cell division septal protein FtsQ
MKLKAQPPVQRGGKGRPRRARGRIGRPARRRGARRPGVPLRRRLSGRLPSIRRVLAALGALASAAVLVALLNGPWLRVSGVAWGGEHYTEASDLERLLDQQRGVSLLAVDTRALRERIERIPSVGTATVSASLTGSVEATVVEREPAFVWQTASARFLGSADGTIFVGDRGDTEPDAGSEALPLVSDERFVARLITVGDVIPAALLRVALRVGEIDPAVLGSDASSLAVRLDDEYGFRLVSDAPDWEVALGVYGLDPRETPAQADARLERQVSAVRTLFASQPEDEIGWVDVRNPGKVYFRAKG